MDKSDKRSFVLGGIVAIIVLMIVLSANGIRLGPGAETEVMGCNNYAGQDPPPPYGNCVIDGLVLLNKKEYPKIDETQLRFDINKCMQDKGYKVPDKGLNYYGQKDAIACKKKIMKDMGYDETIGTGGGSGPSNPVAQTSPFKNNCPSTGTWILFSGGGHASACLVLSCNPRTGEAKLECEDSGHAPPTGMPKPFPVSVGKTGTITTTPPSQWSGGQGSYWTQVNYPG